jgi:hypothetical protein
MAAFQQDAGEQVCHNIWWDICGYVQVQLTGTLLPLLPYLQAERRELQESQRAAKAAAKAQQVSRAGAGARTDDTDA